MSHRSEPDILIGPSVPSPQAPVLVGCQLRAASTREHSLTRVLRPPFSGADSKKALSHTSLFLISETPKAPRTCTHTVPNSLTTGPQAILRLLTLPSPLPHSEWYLRATNLHIHTHTSPYIHIMDPSQNRGRSPSAGHQQPPHISNSHSPSPARPYNPAEASNIGLGIELDSSSGQPFAGTPDYSNFNPGGSNFLDAQQAQPYSGDTSFPGFNPQLDAGNNDLSSFAQQQQPLPTEFGNDFTIFPPSTGEQFNAPLFAGDQGLGQAIGSPDNNNNNMAQAHHQPTPPHMLNPEPTSAHHSPAFNQTQFVPSPGHSRNVSLGPEAALLPGQDWNQFRQHRRSPSEYSEVSSVGNPSPNLGVHDSFDQVDSSHSPMQRPQDPTVMQELHGIGGFSLSDRGRSPSHSPAISPRILPQQITDMNQQNFTLASNGYMGSSQPYGGQEAFPSLPQTNDASQGYQQAPVINIDFAPPPVRSNFQGRSSLDTDALTPPERGEFPCLPHQQVDMLT